MLNPSFFIAVEDSLVGFAILVITERRAVPASLPLIPLFAIKPVARAISWIEYPIAPAAAPTYLKVSPIISTFVLAFEDAAAMTSANVPLSDADFPKAVSASVTISEVLARSDPEAAARFMIPPIPETISFVFHPAIAMYSIAFAASVAENCVVAPICFAFDVSSFRSFPVAPEIDATEDIALSKFVPALMAPVVRLFSPFPTTDTAFDPIAAIAPNPIPLVSVLFRFSA